VVAGAGNEPARGEKMTIKGEDELNASTFILRERFFFNLTTLL
jgi:hypothetical protein